MHVRCFCTVILIFLAFYQLSYTQRNDHLQHVVMLTGEIYMPPSNLTANPYLTQDWVRGTISTNSGKCYANQLLKYNRLLDELFWLSPEKYQHIMLDKSKISSFSYVSASDTLIFEIIHVPDAITGKTSSVFAQRIYEGSVHVFAIRSARLSSRTETVNLRGRSVQQQILQNRNDYFVYLPEQNRYVSLRLHKRSLIALFPAQEKEMKVFLRKNRLNIKREDQLLRAFRMIDDHGFLERN